MFKANFYIKKIIFLGFFYLSFFTILSAQEVFDLKAKLGRCSTCHSMSGNSSNSIWPKLAGQHKDYLLKQLLEYNKGKSGNRFNPTMYVMLQNLTENDMHQLSDYYSKKTIEKSWIKKDRKKIEVGRHIYFFGNKENNVPACVGCHGIDGSGNKLANFPSLKWQHRDYLLTQLKNFKLSTRSNDVNGVMRSIASSMSNQDMESVSMYLALMN